MGRGTRLSGGEELRHGIRQPHVPHAEQRVVAVHRRQHGLAHGGLDVATGKQGRHRLQGSLLRPLILLIEHRARLCHGTLHHGIGIRLRHHDGGLGGSGLVRGGGLAGRALAAGPQGDGQRHTGQRTGIRRHLHDS
ncbi:hypothetical protein D3C72_2045690 [compost metagenome]